MCTIECKGSKPDTGAPQAETRQSENVASELQADAMQLRSPTNESKPDTGASKNETRECKPSTLSLIHI